MRCCSEKARRSRVRGRRGALRREHRFDVNHLLPLAVYPMNELWNLVPADPVFNQHTKRDRLPSLERLQQSEPHRTNVYTVYEASLPLRTALTNDMVRFGNLLLITTAFPQQIARAAIQLIDTAVMYCNLARF